MALPVQAIRLGVIGVVIGGYITFKYVSAGMVEDKISAAMTKAGIPLETVSYDASVDLFGLNTHLCDVKVNIPGQQSIEIDEITINAFDDKHDVPEFMDIEISGIKAKQALLSSSITRGADEIFNSMDEVNMNLVINYEFDADKKTLTIKELSESVDDLGEISFETVLHDVNSLQSFTRRVMIQPNSIAIGKSELEYEDDSLVEKIIAMNAKKQGVSADDYKKSLLKQLNRKLEKVKKEENADLEENLLSEMIDFINSPDEFEISIDPETPVTFREILRGSSEENIKKMNLEIN
jgi:hypothetical protein